MALKSKDRKASACKANLVFRVGIDTPLRRGWWISKTFEHVLSSNPTIVKFRV
jgi:hypothetical protein